jgi:hypothetical protein
MTDLPTTRRPPFVVRAYCCFAIVVTIFAMIRLVVGSQMSEVVPYTGWSCPFYYSITILFAAFAAYSPKCGHALHSVRRFLLLFIVLGVVDFLWLFGGEDFGNPYLQVSPCRPVFTVLLPFIWLLLLRSRTVSEYVISNPPPPIGQQAAASE